MQFVYVKEAFMPALEEEVGMLFEVRSAQSALLSEAPAQSVKRPLVAALWTMSCMQS